MRWVPREPPLAPVAAAAWGEAAGRLCVRLRAALDRGPTPWRGIGGRGWLLVVGEGLPWVDGIRYLGRHAAAPRLLLPTALRPELEGGIAAEGLLDAAIARRCAGRSGPFAVVPALGLVEAGAALPVDRAGLEAWAAERP